MGALNILIVEDDRLISLMLSKMVERMSYNVVGIHPDGDSAIQSVKEKQVDLILMDIMLEGNIDGIEAMETIRGINGSVPVIYITGNSDPSTKERAQKTQYKAFLNKPVNYEQLRSAISSIDSD
ncbi:MAG: response regulator [Balneolaceae bacterium]|nr:response regulator [Balneolaceae bacterium]